MVEAQTEAEQLLQTTEKFIQKNIALLTQQEILDTTKAMQALQFSLSLADKNLTQSKIEELNQLSKPYAERIMDNAIAFSLKGKEV